MLTQFSRTELLLGQEAMQKLASCRVAVFGIGGVGGYTVEALVRSGVGAIDLIDDDKVCLTNINRQLYATRKTVGQYKVDVAAERIAEINPKATVRTYKTFYTPDTADQFDFSQYDYVVDAIDTVTGKINLVLQAQAAGTPIISSMGAGNKLDPTAFQVADIYETSVCPLAKVMRKELSRRGVKSLKVVYSKEKPLTPIDEADVKQLERNLSQNENMPKRAERRQIPGSTAFVPPVVGLIIAGEVIKDLTKAL
ncbi:MAG: tRNA threonylcarbamoyladenosine dehydratase [Clostridiales bacterium]|nr:tRNA threonylcarbamoyladenosine dehydratase [Clostridiales bacterium]